IAASAEEALEKAALKSYDLVLMDINLGRGASGLDVTQQLRTRPEYRSTPIIALTAYAMKGDRETAIGAGCSDYISKPFSRAELTDKLKEYLTNS
ncbi:MAG TPA: response regulator, partial [Candidatus Kapabacteria bacterium]|nr:response regulator [Candidatus Kapabacteria bacterium]